MTDINLSLDDRFLYVSCWGTGELRQYDVTDPSTPKLTGSVKLGGIVERAAHPKNPAKPLNGGPQMVEVSRDGRRVYVTNSLYTPWDAQFYPDGIRGWVAKVDAKTSGGITFDRRFLRRDAGRVAATPGAPRGRRRVVGLVLLRVMTAAHPEWVSIALLGGLHGVNPAMGWLFAASLGLQAQSGARGVVRARAAGARTCALRRGGAGSGCCARDGPSSGTDEMDLRGRAAGFRRAAPAPSHASALVEGRGRNVRRAEAADDVVVPRVVGSWRGTDAVAVRAGPGARRQRAETPTRSPSPAVTRRPPGEVSSYPTQGTNDGAVRDAAPHRRLLRRGRRDRMGRLLAAGPALPAQCVDQHERRLGRRTDRDRRGDTVSIR